MLTRVHLSQILLSCEHASNKIPAPYQPYFKGASRALEDHTGWDIGALACAQFVAKQLKRPLIAGQYSRLLIELNRSAHHPKLFSRYTKTLPIPIKETILEDIYHPYRKKIQAHLDQLIKAYQSVCHLSIHSFTPKLDGEIRQADLAFLYCPSRSKEKDLSYAMKEHLLKSHPKLKIRMNYPYRGNSDGLTTALRKHYKEKHYIGIEIEMNQKFFLTQKPAVNMKQILLEAIQGIT